MARVAINGMGRIGRAAFKIILDEPQLELVAVNDLVPADNLAYLLQYDSAYGRYQKPVTARAGARVGAIRADTRIGSAPALRSTGATCPTRATCRRNTIDNNNEM